MGRCTDCPQLTNSCTKLNDNTSILNVSHSHDKTWATRNPDLVSHRIICHHAIICSPWRLHIQKIAAWPCLAQTVLKDSSCHSQPREWLTAISSVFLRCQRLIFLCSYGSAPRKLLAQFSFHFKVAIRIEETRCSELLWFELDRIKLCGVEGGVGGV